MRKRITPIFSRFARREEGGFQVEFAITLPILILLSIGLLEFSLIAFDYQRAAEATRRAVRFAILDNPIANTANLLAGQTIQCTSTGGEVSCTGGSPADSPEYPPDTGDQNFQAMLALMRDVYDGIEEENVRVTYESTDVGGEELIGGIIPLVTIEVINLQHELVTGSIIGIGTLTYPDFKTSVLGSGRTVNAT